MPLVLLPEASERASSRGVLFLITVLCARRERARVCSARKASDSKGERFEECRAFVLREALERGDILTRGEEHRLA